jgi:hypothetical protein
MHQVQSRSPALVILMDTAVGDDRRLREPNLESVVCGELQTAFGGTNRLRNPIRVSLV